MHRNNMHHMHRSNMHHMHRSSMHHTHRSKMHRSSMHHMHRSKMRCSNMHHMHRSSVPHMHGEASITLVGKLMPATELHPGELLLSTTFMANSTALKPTAQVL